VPVRLLVELDVELMPLIVLLLAIMSVDMGRVIACVVTRVFVLVRAGAAADEVDHDKVLEAL
jgi:hypothetical protein